MNREVRGLASVALPGRCHRKKRQPGAACVALATPLPLAKYGRPVRGVPTIKCRVPSFLGFSGRPEPLILTYRAPRPRSKIGGLMEHLDVREATLLMIP
jgi:hypothetical protein